MRHWGDTIAARGTTNSVWSGAPAEVGNSLETLEGDMGVWPPFLVVTPTPDRNLPDRWGDPSGIKFSRPLWPFAS